jgi:type VI secretion system protein ImpB
MDNSFQNEVPRSRVNITLELDDGGASRKTELPFKMLAMGDYSNGQASGLIRERQRIPVDRNNLESVLNELAPSVHYQVPNRLSNDDRDVDVRLTFQSYRDFHPEQVAQNIPQINNMLAMRNLLKDLKSNLLDNGRFRRELEAILADQPQLRELIGELERIAPLEEAQPSSPEATDSGASADDSKTDSE